ncbi:MAG TPA: ABC transporter substrate-binding protein [Thermoanaerobaculia bacterium]|nr:ABC transporter substrate-binding protein [Thermoanaerobaculia bacterium]
MRSKMLWLIALVIACIIAITFLQQNRGNSQLLPVVAVTQIATHPALDEVRAGLIAGLAKRGLIKDKTITIVFRNANGDASLTLPIAQEFVRMSPAVIVPISTPSALSAAKATSTIPIVFSGVTDPVGVGLVTNLEKPGANITGVSDRWPFEAQVLAFQRLFPNSHRIGMLYTRGDDVSKIGVLAMRALSSRLHFTLLLSPVSAAADVYPSAVALLRDVDTIYTGIDHLLLENLDGLVKASREAHKPLFGGESGSVEKGAVLALSINMTDFGDLTADLTAKVLRGAKPGDLPVRIVSKGDLLINKSAAQLFGLDVSALRAKGATIVSSQ